MGVILFTMVTGAMPYLTEASINDPLYKMILRRDRTSYWDTWRSIRLSNTKNEKVDEDFEGVMTDQSFLEDL